jgi:hypothetical protein
MQQKQGVRKKKSKQSQGKRASTPATTVNNVTTAITAPASPIDAIADATITATVTATDDYAIGIECALGDIGCLSASPSVPAPTVNAPPSQHFLLLPASAASHLALVLLVLALLLAPASASSMGAPTLVIFPQVLQQSDFVWSLLTWLPLCLALPVTAGSCFRVRSWLTAVPAHWVFDDGG